MAIGRILGKTLKKSVSKDKKGTSITSLYEQGKKVQKKKEDIKELKKGAKAVAGAGAAVGAVGVAGNKIEKERKENKKAEERAKARTAKSSTSTPSITSGSTLKQRQKDAEAIKAGVEAGKRSKAKLEKDIKDARTKRALSDMESAISKAGKMTAEEKRKRETKSYKIKSGDTLSAIARANGTTVATLMKLNPSIKDKDKIYAGKSMKLPNK